MSFSIQRRRILILSLVAMTMAVSAAAHAAPRCNDVFLQPKLAPFETSHVSLFDRQASETAGKNRFSVGMMNRRDLKALEDYIPPVTSTTRAWAMSYDSLSPLLAELKRQDVVENVNRYQPENVEIGYCFGRAAFVHLMLLKMGLQKPSVLKVWAVGPQKNPSGGKNWGFHVATVAYVRGYGWMAIDSNSFIAQPIRHWFSSYYERSIDGKMRFFVTPAGRFGVTAPLYSRLEMGLDLKKEDDWYRHYFVDMMSSLRGLELHEHGLRRLSPANNPPKLEAEPSEIKPSPLRSIKDFIWG